MVFSAPRFLHISPSRCKYRHFCWFSRFSRHLAGRAIAPKARPAFKPYGTWLVRERGYGDGRRRNWGREGEKEGKKKEKRSTKLDDLANLLIFFWCEGETQSKVQRTNIKEHHVGASHKYRSEYRSSILLTNILNLLRY